MVLTDVHFSVPTNKIWKCYTWLLWLIDFKPILTLVRYCPWILAKASKSDEMCKELRFISFGSGERRIAPDFGSINNTTAKRKRKEKASERPKNIAFNKPQLPSYFSPGICPSPASSNNDDKSRVKQPSYCSIKSARSSFFARLKEQHSYCVSGFKTDVMLTSFATTDTPSRHMICTSVLILILWQEGISTIQWR